MSNNIKALFNEVNVTIVVSNNFHTRKTSGRGAEPTF
jgi:hypothetical protein